MVPSVSLNYENCVISMPFPSEWHGGGECFSPIFIILLIFIIFQKRSTLTPVISSTHNGTADL